MPDDLRLTHIGICVSDLARSVAFYRDALGLEPVGELRVAGEPTSTLLGVDDLDLELVYLERDGVRVELLRFLGPGTEDGAAVRPFNHVGLTHISVRVASIDAVVDRIVAAGGSLVEGTLVRFDGGSRGVLTLDPDGTRIELIERAP